jgi:murein DD-endopeptidase MepM/ murein hydrolase activator NlpD
MVRGVAALVLALAGVSACAHEPPAPARPRATPRADIILPIQTRTIAAVVPRHATLEALLLGHDLPLELVQAVVDAVRLVFNPRELRAERPYRLVRSLDGFLREFEYEIDADRFLRVVSRDQAQPTSLEAAVLPIEKDTTVVAIRGSIDADHSSLIAAMDETGENVQLAIGLAEIFSGQIDFNSDLQPGDWFEVLFEKSTREGQFAGYGPVLGARFSNDGTLFQAFRWTNPDTSKSGYYDENGRSLKRFFLRSPLRFEPRVTSGFSRRRFHPVHRTYRAHLGVDYGAPRGSPVVAVASGVVVSAGWAGGGGNQVRIRHASGYESYYLHLSSFARGIRAGARVDQGQVIGRVGATGTATGPHLDYRLRRNGLFVNPLAEHRRLPPGDPIPAAHLAAFSGTRDTLVGQLSGTLLADAAPDRKPDPARSATQ